MDPKEVLKTPEFLTAPKRGACKKLITDASAYDLGPVLL